MVVVVKGGRRRPLSAAETCAEEHRRAKWDVNPPYRRSYERTNPITRGLKSKWHRLGGVRRHSKYKRISGRYIRSNRDRQRRHRSRSLNKNVANNRKNDAISLAMTEWWANCKRARYSGGRNRLGPYGKNQIVRAP